MNYIIVVPGYPCQMCMYLASESVIFVYEATFVVDGIHKLARGRRHYELQGLRQEILPSCCKCLLDLISSTSPMAIFFKVFDIRQSECVQD